MPTIMDFAGVYPLGRNSSGGSLLGWEFTVGEFTWSEYSIHQNICAVKPLPKNKKYMFYLLMYKITITCF